MSKLNGVSRRKLLHSAAAAAAGVAGAVALAGVSDARAQGQRTKAQVSYMDHPNGQQHCGLCAYFQPPANCGIVAGTISPNGWCWTFRAKAG